jgi:hypothetical protein
MGLDEQENQDLSLRTKKGTLTTKFGGLTQLMFNLFKKSDAEKTRDHISRMNAEIDKAGGPIAVCHRFVQVLTEDELFKTLGIFNETKLPYPQSQLMLASLLLLSQIKSSPQEFGDDNLEFARSIAKASFVYPSSAVTDEELGEFLLMPANEAMEAIRHRKDKYIEAWERWLTTDLDLYELFSAR